MVARLACHSLAWFWTAVVLRQYEDVLNTPRNEHYVYFKWHHVVHKGITFAT
jgi:hypothetical protein